eukprot:TRINITY_DN8769_c0_g1_i1.p1 TRINITY_DN8769_c0_g1~~TRINITY_DN8769_c0_g1_i1.p1  ORF type:complete len:319 (+),score=79.19 TRINITY_DN8769_c0_g1_i1:62-1018(+)
MRRPASAAAAACICMAHAATGFVVPSWALLSHRDHQHHRLLAAESGAGDSQQPTSGSSDDPAALLPAEVDLRAFRARLVAYGLDYGNSDVQPAIAPPAVETVKGESPPAEARRDKWAHALAAPEKGCLLLARDGMFGESQKYFKNAVILVIEHGATGSVGLILNQPTVRSMGEVTGGDSGLAHLPGLELNRLYFGGDVGKRRDDGLDVVNFMHGRDDCEGIEVIKGVKLGGLPDALALVAQGKADPSEFKFFVRFCGWGPGQLAREVKLGAWYAAACDVGTVLNQYTDESQPAALWTEVLARMGGKYKALAEKWGGNR